MPLFLQLPFAYREDSMAIDAATDYSAGVQLPEQCGALALYADFTATGVGSFGSYQMYLETQVGGADWVDTGEIFPLITAAGLYTFVLSSPVLDRVRIRIDGTSTTGASVQFSWLADTAGIAAIVP